MRYELADHEWTAIKPMLPNKPRGVPLRQVAARRAGVWGRIITLATDHDAAVQMIDTSIVRVHQHGACITRNQRQSSLSTRKRSGFRLEANYAHRVGGELLSIKSC